MREKETRSRSMARVLRRKLTDAETILWSRLRGGGLNGWRFRRQHPVGNYVADFACVKAHLIIEVDGATHSSPKQRAHDAARTTYLKNEGWRVLRVWNTDIYDNLNGVMDALLAALPPSALPGHSPRERGEKGTGGLESPL
ncbi:MAG: putative DNA methylase [Oceanicaulis sp. HLUCCA04]|nr:MAG: putative DNA methylase [Oceanicaulis sp. HLUCCA04]